MIRTVAVIGGGIVGLAVAREAIRRLPGVEVTVFEKEDRLAAHQTGRNSGVVHAGLYYRPDSLKAQLCRRGRDLLKEFCAEHNVSYVERGKVVVAVDESELAALDNIEQRSRANQVPGLRRLDAAGLREIEPHISGLAGLHSPRTAVVDYRAVCDVLAAQITQAGGSVLLSTPVTDLRVVGTQASVNGRRFDRVIGCAGLHSDALARRLGRPGDVRIIAFRGEYHTLSERAAKLVNGLVYPVPDPRYPFLGVHLTRGIDDEVHVGPNAVMALALEGYRWRDVHVGDLGRMLAWPGMWHLARRHWRAGVRELGLSLSRRRFAAAVRRYLPALEASDLAPYPSGVRAQAVSTRGELIDDFVIDRSGPIALVRNAPSPAATASLAIAEHIWSEVLR